MKSSAVTCSRTACGTSQSPRSSLEENKLRLALNVYTKQLTKTLSQWAVTPPDGKIGETVERMCSEMCAKYGADARVVLRIRGRDYVTGQFRTVSSDKIKLQNVTYDLIGRLVVDDWHLKPKDAVFELTLL